MCCRNVQHGHRLRNPVLIITTRVGSKMRVLAISFTTRPHQGSEGGVGWEFTRAWAKICSKLGYRLDLIIDERDEIVVTKELDLTGLGSVVDVHAIQMAAPLARHYGDSRSRGSYLVWLAHARRQAARLMQQNDYLVTHQYTFATGSLPPVVTGTRTSLSVWGPIAMPFNAVHVWGSPATYRERLAVQTSRRIGKVFAGRMGYVLSQNDLTHATLKLQGVKGIIEPNIVVDGSIVAERNQDILVFSGSLVDRKRPWLCVQALTHASLRNHRLVVLGTGPLRKALESYCVQERIDNRVEFCGRVSREESQQQIARAGALLLPSIREGAPWVVGEAAASGVPSIVTNSSGASTVVRLSGDLGTVLAETDEPELARRIATAARSASERTWTPSTRWESRRLEGLLQSLLHGERGRGPGLREEI